MRKPHFTAVRITLSRLGALFSHDPAQTGVLVTVALSGLASIALFGLYGDLLLPNLAVVAAIEALIVCYGAFVAALIVRLVRTQDRWQVESALTLRDMLSGGRDAPVSVQAGSPFHAGQLRLRLEEEIRKCKEYGTSLSVVAVRLELPGQAPSRAGFTQANLDMAQLVMSHREALVCPTALGMFEYAFCLPNCERRSARAMIIFVATALRRHRCFFGLAVFPDDGEDADTLLRHATRQCGMLHDSAA